MLRVIRNSCLTISRRTFLERETAPDADSPSTVIDRCRSMGAKLSVLPGTGETDPQGFERVTLGSTQASAVGIGCQLIVRRRRHAARLPQWRGSSQTPPSEESELDSVTS